MDCIFCKIVKGEIPSYKVYEDELILAFLDLNPVSIGHTLIIPKKHFENIKDIEDKVLFEINLRARELSKVLEEKLSCEGISLCQNNGLGQEIKHYHLHLIPRYQNDNLKFYVNDEAKSVLEETFSRLKDN